MKFKDPEFVKLGSEDQGTVLYLQPENAQQVQRIRELEEALKTQGKMKFDAPFYYLEGDQVPFCPNCWDVKKLTVHMGDENRDGSFLRCTNCKFHFADPTKEERRTIVDVEGGSPWFLTKAPPAPRLPIAPAIGCQA